VTLLAYSPLAAGLLTGKYQGDVVPKGSRRENGPDLFGRVTPRSFAAVDAYLDIAERHGLDPGSYGAGLHGAAALPGLHDLRGDHVGAIGSTSSTVST
jgi:hypothetical protein